MGKLSVILTKTLVCFVKQCTDISIAGLEGFALDEQICTNGSLDNKKVGQHGFNVWF